LLQSFMSFHQDFSLLLDLPVLNQVKEKDLMKEHKTFLLLLHLLPPRSHCVDGCWVEP